VRKSVKFKNLDTFCSGEEINSSNNISPKYNQIYFPGILDNIPIPIIRVSRNQLRANNGANNDLLQSIQQKGLLQPILVRTINDESFEVVAGNRRLQACKVLRWRKIPCYIVELNDKEAFEISIVENIQRRSLNPVEEAQAFKTYVSGFGWGGVSELAMKIGKSPSYVTKRIKLLELPQEVLNSLVELTLNATVAEELFSIKDKEKQSELAKMIRKRHLSSRKVRSILKDLDSTNKHDEEDYLLINNAYANCADIGQSLRPRKAIEKSIVVMKIALSRLGEIIEEAEDDWIVHEILMQHKNMVHSEINILIREKLKHKERL
jgi:ParB family chromosome partitioning protein